MSLLTPYSLLWALPVLGAILALYLLKLRRKEMRVSSVMLWHRAVQDLQANAPFQRLRPNLLLLLQILAVLLLTVALARPFLRAAADPGGHIALILDASASMKATDVPGSRFGEAKRQALKLLNNLSPRDRAMVLLCGARTQQIAPLEADRQALTRAVNGLQAADSGSDLREGILLASSLLSGRKGAQIVVFSDGAVDPLGDLNLGRTKLGFVRCGKRSENVAVTSLDLRARPGANPGGESRLGTFVSMRNFGAAPRTFNLELYRDDALADVREETLGPGAEKGEVFDGPAGARESVKVRLDLRDDLAADNEAVLPVRPPSRVRVLLVTPGNLFLEKALAALPAVELTKTASAPRDTGGYDLHVYDRTAPVGPGPAVGMLLIDCQGADGPADLGAAVRQPRIVDWRRDTPLSRYVDFSGIGIETGHRLRPRPWASPLAETADGAVMAYGERDGRRSVQVGFDLLRSDFPLRVGFPIFLANCIGWLAPGAGYGPGLSARAGEELALNLPPEARRVTVTGPAPAASDAFPSRRVEEGRLLLGATERVGLYTAAPDAGAPVRFAVNLFNPRESDLTPGDLRLRAGEKETVRASGLSGRRELWRWAALVALLLLLLEWGEYHLRFLGYASPRRLWQSSLKHLKSGKAAHEKGSHRR